MNSRGDIDDDRLVAMYADETNLMSELETEFDACARTLRRHIRAKGVKTDRKESSRWTMNEECALYDAKHAGLTGAELQEAVPSRTLASIKGHVVAMRCRGVHLP